MWDTNIQLIPLFSVLSQQKVLSFTPPLNALKVYKVKCTKKLYKKFKFCRNWILWKMVEKSRVFFSDSIIFAKENVSEVGARKYSVKKGFLKNFFFMFLFFYIMIIIDYTNSFGSKSFKNSLTFLCWKFSDKLLHLEHLHCQNCYFRKR